jgi:hypothetical protein
MAAGEIGGTGDFCFSLVGSSAMYVGQYALAFVIILVDTNPHS